MDQTEAVVRGYIDACNGGDVERIFAVLDPQVELHEASALPGPVSAVGLEEARRYFERFATHWSRLRWEPLELRVSGDRALMRATLELEGRSSGIEVSREWLYIFTVRDGKLLRQDGYNDIASAERAFEADPSA